MATRIASISSAERRRRPRARCEPIERRRRPGLDAPRVAVVRERVELPAGRPPHHRDEQRLVEPGHLADGRDPDGVEPGGGDPAHPPQPLDREGMEEAELLVRRHHEQAVRLRDPARDLGEELRPRHADRDRQADALEHVPAQPRGDLGRRAGEPPQPANVEERLVDREPLDQRGRVLEHLEHGLAGLGVGRHPRLDDHRVRAEPARTGAAHRGADAVRLRLVAGREDDAASDDHRPSAQARVVPLLDRREERVHVGVQDRRLRRHEHMFAYGPSGGPRVTVRQ